MQSLLKGSAPRAIILCLSLFAAAFTAHAQTPSSNEDASILLSILSDVEAGSGVVTVDSGQAAQAKASAGKLSRWFDLQMATLNLRYRYIDNSSGVVTTNQLQHREVFKGRLKFDADGKYSLNAGVFTGRAFNGGWNNTGWGTGDGQTNLSVKQLYFSAAPVEGLELQYGGLYLNRGESTEITTYDEDGYIMGERVTIKRPHKLFFDEISVTYAFLGDINTPNINKRYFRLKQSNYHQFLLEKKIGKRAAVSADYTFESGRETMREAIRVDVRESRVLDTARFENYQRAGRTAAYGFALHGEKAITKRLTVVGGYAQIDPLYGGLNADRFVIGKRLFVLSTLRLTSAITVSTFATRAVANSVPVPIRTRVELLISYNLLKGLQRTGWF
jgi:hypothetical protein